MKKGEQPELSARWWKASQPDGLRSAGRLEDALKDYETARRKFEADSGEPQAEAASEALDAIGSAVKAVNTEVAKAQGGPELEWTADCLKKFDRLINAARKWIDERTEEADEGEFGAPEIYHEYLLLALKRLRGSGEMNFGLVLGKTAEDHRLALHKAKSAKALAGILVKQTGLHQMTFGIARTDEKRGDVMVLDIEGRQLPGLAKKGTRMLKRFKPVPFKQIKLAMGGRDVDDLDDPNDTDKD
ncbi:MAG: hypothetical protein ACREFY_00550 [Acetobacteraceae bacterium]